MEINLSEPNRNGTMTRRRFLVAFGISAVGGLMGLRHWFKENGPAALLSSFLLKDIEDEVPVEFLNESEDANPFFENPDQLLLRSFQRYNQLNNEDPTQYRPLTFNKRKNYISTEDVLKRYKGFTLEEIVDDIASGRYSVASIALSPQRDTYMVGQSTGGEILYFSRVAVEDVIELIKIDPGSGFINRAISKNFGIDRDKFYSTHTLEKGFSEDERQKIQESVVNELTDALNYFKAERAKSGTPLDLSEALVYFLKLNEGDIYTGLWDSVMFFKLLARNNLNTLDLDPTFDQSILLAELFKDPFSLRNSFNWLAHKYEEKGITKTHLLAQPRDDPSSAGFKNYLIVNRAGGYYHGLNILTWAAVCMDPLLVGAVTLAYSSWNEGNLTPVAEHGSIKIESDLIVALKSPEIRRVVSIFV
ncbi:MAG: hypothetical protein Q7S76_00645 [bacterium]|nr:hypothetical protein [bacterium]